MYLTQNGEDVIEYCVEVVKDLISDHKNYNLTPIDLLALSKATYVLTKYPKETIEGFIDIGSSFRWEGGGCSVAYLIIYSDMVEIFVGGSDYTPGIGSDSYTTLSYSSTENTYMDAQKLDFWREAFFSNISEGGKGLSIEDCAEIIVLEDSDEM